MQRNADHFLRNVVERINQVGDIKADFNGFTAVFDFKLINRLFLLGVVAGNAQYVGIKVHTHAFEFFARQNSRALQGGEQRCAPQRNVVRVVFGDDAVVVRELAFNQLGNELHLAKAKTCLIIGKLHFQRAVCVAEQALQLQHRFARQNHFLLGHFGF